jgi:hypothetical protein
MATKHQYNLSRQSFGRLGINLFTHSAFYPKGMAIPEIFEVEDPGQRQAGQQNVSFST